MKKTLTEKAYAKINLYLAVGNKRDDGFHDIESIMQTVSLADTVTVTADTDCTGRRISVTCTDPSVPCDRRNIVWKCAESFFDTAGIQNVILEIDIEKNIPCSGGLAGGSSDGAAVLRILRRLFPMESSREMLYEIAAGAGSDISFCLTGGTAVCSGKGDTLMPLDIPKPSYHILIVSPGGGVSTPEAYSLIDSKGTGKGFKPMTAIMESLRDGSAVSGLFNSFEEVIIPRIPEVGKVKDMLKACGALETMMSGSGPTVFALFDSEDMCRSALDETEKAGYASYMCRPVEGSTVCQTNM